MTIEEEQCAEIVRLETERDALRAALAGEQETCIRVGNERAKTLLELERLREENARLREALKPFVDASHFKTRCESAVTSENNVVSIQIKQSAVSRGRAAIRRDESATTT